MVDVIGFALGAILTLVVVGLHFTKAVPKPTPDDVADEILERRASTVDPTSFPEPMSRWTGGGGAAAIGAGAEGEGAELEEAEEEAGFDPSAIPDDEVVEVDVTFDKEGETIPIASNENILEAGEEEGWDLPYACREGQCLSCAGRITDGDASEYMQMSNNEVLSDDEIEQGYCLTCVAYPTGEEFSIETSEAP